jgi:hypothetical protein
VQGPRYLYPGPGPRWMRLAAVVATAPGSNDEFVTKGREGSNKRGPLGDDITRLRESARRVHMPVTMGEGARLSGWPKGPMCRRQQPDLLWDISGVGVRMWDLAQEAGDLSFLFISYFISVFYFNFNSKPNFEFQISNLDAQTNNSACYTQSYIFLYIN